MANLNDIEDCKAPVPKHIKAADCTLSKSKTARQDYDKSVGAGLESATATLTGKEKRGLMSFSFIRRFKALTDVAIVWMNVGCCGSARFSPAKWLRIVHAPAAYDYAVPQTASRISFRSGHGLRDGQSSNKRILGLNGVSTPSRNSLCEAKFNSQPPKR